MTTAVLERTPAVWLRWTLPSFADVFFLVFVALLGFSPMSAGLLRDADTGLHIRTGEQILATHTIPRTDPYSYTRHGEPWYAWEWLCDLLFAAIHQVADLNGVVLFCASVIAITFALLFRFLLRRSGNLAVAAFLTLLAEAAAQVHMLARPHILSWLLTLLWVEILYRYQDGERLALLWLPPLMLLWVNIHGGFILGLGLLAIFAVEPTWTALTAPCDGDRWKMAQFAIVFFLCLLTTLLTPYGYELPIHVYRYLSSAFLMDNIQEFQSPNFHDPAYRYFEAFVPLSLAVAWLGRKRLTLTGFLLLLFSLHAGLYGARNIPISVIILSLVLCPLIASGLSAQSRDRLPRWLRSALRIAQDMSNSMGSLESRFRGHLPAAVLMVAAVALVGNGGRAFSTQILNAHFGKKTYPVGAAEFIARRGIRDHLFSPDNWGAYLIYGLYPEFRVYFDDRHDFYGEAFVSEYQTTVTGAQQWRKALDRYQIEWVLMPVDSVLSSLLRESPDWRAEYDDGIAIVFSRARPRGQCPGNKPCW